MVGASDLGPEGREFEAHPVRLRCVHHSGSFHPLV